MNGNKKLRNWRDSSDKDEETTLRLDRTLSAAILF